MLSPAKPVSLAEPCLQSRQRVRYWTLGKDSMKNGVCVIEDTVSKSKY